MTSSALIHSTSNWWNSTSNRGPHRCALYYWVGTGVHNRGPLPESKIVSLDKAPHDSAKKWSGKDKCAPPSEKPWQQGDKMSHQQIHLWTMENIKMKEIEGYIARHGKYLVTGYWKCRIAFMMSLSPVILRGNRSYNFSSSISFSGKRHLLLSTEQEQITS